ncbi:hypothetical protein [Halolamina sp. C58]|uniref:hypothetical protein n=1 Tax=Halolamina sp. C58 TaxID=3421640 RepID=UPI003EB7B14E
MSRRSLGVAAMVVLSVVAGVAIPAAAANTDVAIESVDLSVDQPAPGESFTLTTTIANLESSAGPVEVTDIYVRESGSGRDLARIEDVGSIASGDTRAIPLTMSIDEPGEKKLVVNAVVRDADGDFQSVSYPLYVDVQEPDEAVISFAGLDSVAGEESRVDVTVSNGDDGPLSNVRLELTGAADVENPERVSASIASGTQTTHTFAATFDEPGSRTLTATLTYKTDEGVTRTVTRNVTADVEAATLDPQLTATGTTANGSSVVRATLSEFGNVELRDVQLRAVVDGETVTRTRLADVPAGESRTATLDGSAIPPGEVTVIAEYTAAGETATSETTLSYAPAPTRGVTVTGVDASRSGGVVTISGDAANVGSLDASSVVMRVVAAEGVTPVSPNKEYFVGAVDSSEFATFQLTANVSASVTEVPVRIEYTVDGERLSRVVELDVSDAAPSGGGQGSGGSGGSLLLGALVVLLAVGLGAALTIAYRRYRG